MCLRLRGESWAPVFRFADAEVSRFLNQACSSVPVGTEFQAIPEVGHVALVAGEHDILLRVRARDATSLRDVVLTRIQEIPEVRSTQTILIFAEAAPCRDNRREPGT